MNEFVDIVYRLADKISHVLQAPAKHRADFMIFITGTIVLLIIILLLFTIAYLLIVPPPRREILIQPTDRARRRRRLALTAGGWLLAAFLLFGSGYLVDSQLTTSSSCSRCHIMRRTVRLWKTSTHSEVKCVSCHADGGLTGFGMTKSRQLSALFWYAVRPDLSELVAKPIPDDNCLECHGDAMEMSTIGTGGIRMDHAGLRKGGFLCLDCHADVGHRDPDQGAKITSMEICLRCHTGLKPSRACDTCHSSQTGRPYNTAGKKATVPLVYKGCSTCHGGDQRCHNCHFGFELPHAPAFVAGGHAGVASNLCIKCHKEGDSFCVNCHRAVSASAASPGSPQGPGMDARVYRGPSAGASPTSSGSGMPPALEFNQ